MKRCPQCGREYDVSMSFCLDDGAELLYGPASMDEPETAILHDTAPPAGASTHAQIHTTERTAVRLPADDATATVVGIDKRLLLVPLAVAIIIAGLLGYGYFQRADSGAIGSIAVLPFENIGRNPDSEYLSDGLAESLIYRLSQIPELKVSPRSSVFRYKGQPVEAQRVGGELGVDAVMSGRMMKRGDVLTISVDLVDVRKNKTLWGEQFERKSADLLATQREIASIIANKLQLKLSPDGQKGLAKRYTESNEAYQYYLRGRHHWNRRTKEGVERSIQEFQRAIELDPNFALAHYGIASAYVTMPSYAYLSPKEAIPRALAASRRALEIDPELAEAHTSYAAALVYEYRWGEAEAEFRRAIDLDSDSAQAHYQYSLDVLAPTARLDAALAEINRALELEPLSIAIGANLAGMYVYARKYDAALEQALKVYALEPGHPTATYWLGWVYVANENYAEAIELCEKDLRSFPENQDLLQILGYAYAKKGLPRETERIIAKFEEIGKRQYVVPYRVATLHAVLGNRDRAFAELERSYETRDWDFARLKIDPFVDSLRDDPRFPKLLEKLKLPE